MQGGIYQIRIQGVTDNLPHPHVLVLEVGDECLMVPAFTRGGSELESFLRWLDKLNVPRAAASVELDNSLHVTWFGGTKSHIACWLVWRCQPPISKKVVNAANKIGRMDDRGILEILRCMLRLAEARPDFFSKNRLRRIRETAKAFGAKVSGLPPE